MNTTRMKTRFGTRQSLDEHYGCGPVKLSGDSNAFYERHVEFDHVVAETETTDRDKFEAIARSVRDMLSQRWLKTEQNYRQRNVKRVYYLSMEFLLGRSLANNITNLQLDPEAHQFAKQHQLDPLRIFEQEPDAGLGNGGLSPVLAPSTRRSISARFSAIPICPFSCRWSNTMTKPRRPPKPPFSGNAQSITSSPLNLLARQTRHCWLL